MGVMKEDQYIFHIVIDDGCSAKKIEAILTAWSTQPVLASCSQALKSIKQNVLWREEIWRTWRKHLNQMRDPTASTSSYGIIQKLSNKEVNMYF